MSKTESLPSDKNVILKAQRKAQVVISPHLRVLQFLESHFNATRLRSVHTQKVFQRLISTTLTALPDTNGHPLAREFHFHIILFGLKILRYCPGQGRTALWKLKDQILSAALSWFRHPPK
jgi:phosphatidylinositol 4-kinase